MCMYVYVCVDSLAQLLFPVKSFKHEKRTGKRQRSTQKKPWYFTVFLAVLISHSKSCTKNVLSLDTN